MLNKFEDSDYVYSISVFRNGDNFPFGWVSSGENTGLKVFKKDGEVKISKLYLNYIIFEITEQAQG